MIQIEITTLCNARCVYCFKQGVQGANYHNMDFEDFKKIIDSIPWKNNRWLLQGDGEPLLCPDIYKMCDYVYEKDPESIIEIITNGSLLDEKVFYKLIEHHINRISISVDAAEETYEKLRKGMKWNKVQEILNIVKHYKETAEKPISIGITMVLMKSTLQDLNAFLEYVSGFSIDFVSINSLIDIFGHFQDEVLENVEPALVNQVLDEAKALAARKGIELYPPLVGKKEEIKISAADRCSFFERSMYISVDGEIDPCCMLSQHGTWGNIKNADLSKVEEFRQQWDSGNIPLYCRKCIKDGIAFIGK